MIHIITPANEGDYRDEMEQAWRLRHEIFVTEKGWSDLARPDGREIDQFDTPHAIHFLAIEDGRVIGYSRLLPTTRPHLLSEIMPQLCEGERPCGTRTWEWTRQAVARSHRARGKVVNPVSLALLTGIVEWGMHHGVSRLVLQMPTLYLLHVVQLHFRARPARAAPHDQRRGHHRGDGGIRRAHPRAPAQRQRQPGFRARTLVLRLSRRLSGGHSADSRRHLEDEGLRQQNKRALPMYSSAMNREDHLQTLAGHCIAAREIIETSGTLVMRQLVDLLLFEIGVAMAKATEAETQTGQQSVLGH